MKNLIAIFLILFSCHSSSTHSELEQWMTPSNRIKVLSTTQMIGDLVVQIGRDRIDHLVLISGEIDPHSYELMKGDDEKISFAAIVFSNGLGLEHGASLSFHLQKHFHSVALGEEIKKFSIDKALVIDGQVDPHIWMDISLWSCGIPSIVAALSEEDPEGADFYYKNGELLRQKMLAAHKEIQSIFEEIPSEKRYLVTSHNAFNYFSRAYLSFGQWESERCAAPEGLSPDGQLSTCDIQRIIDHLCARRISVIFSESNVSKDSLNKIISCCQKRGLKVRICSKPLYADCMSADMENYLEMIRYNAEVMKNEWKSS